MSKNLTRKGLAFGALVALGSSVLAGAPAYAADTVVLAADYSVDKTLAAPISDSLRLNASLAPGSTAANITQLKYKIVTDGTFVAKVTGVSGATPTSTSAVTSSDAFASQTANYTAANVKTTTYYAPTTPDASTKNSLAVQVYAIPGATDGGAGSAPVLTGATATASKSVTVTAFIDANLNSLLDTGEASAEQTIKFLKYSEITTSTTITSPTQGDTTATALVKFTNVNNQAIADTAAANATTGSGNASNAASLGAYFTYGDGTALKRADAPAAITGATVSGGNLLTVTATHALTTGDTVTLAGLSAYNGTYTVTGTTSTTAFTVALTTGSTNGALTLTSATFTRSVVKATAAVVTSGTLVVTAKNKYAVGDVVTLAGFGTADGSYTVTAVTADTDFTVTTTGAVTTQTGTVTRTASNTEAVQFTPVASFSSTLDGFKFTTGTVPALEKSSAIKVQPLFNSKAALTVTLGAGGTKNIGTAQTASVVTRVVGSITANFVKSTTAAAANAASASEAEAVALNAAKTVEFLVKDTATTAKALAGQVVTVKVETSATLSATRTLTVNGTTYTANTALPGYSTTVAKLSVTTGADGKALVNYTTAGYADPASGATVTITAYIENYSAAAVGTETDRVFRQYIANNEGNVAVTTDGTAVSLNVIVQDQFGGAPADGKYQINAAAVSSTQTTAGTTASSTYAPVVSGKATLTITDNGTGTGTNVYGLARYTLTNGVAGSPVAMGTIATPGTSATASTFGSAGTDTQFTIYVKAAADVAPGAVTLTGATKSATTGIYSLDSGTGATATGTTVGLTYSAFKSVDERTVAVIAPSILNNAGTAAPSNPYATISGNVASASTATYGGVAIPSASVTFAGKGLMFKAQNDSTDIWGDGTLTINADALGDFTVYAYSHIAGANTVTITSGTGSASVKIYATAAAVADASTVTVKVADGAAQFQAGRALDVVVAVADTFGNPVATSTASTPTDLSIGYLKLAQTGAGYLANSGFVSTGVDGTYTTKLITNAGDLGTANISVYLNQDNADDTLDLAVKSTSEFGITDVTDISSAGKAIYVNTEFAKGKVVTVYIDGKRMPVKAAEATDNAVERKYTQKKAGKHTVTVRVSGGVVASETVVTTK